MARGQYGFVHKFHKSDGMGYALKVNFNPKTLTFANAWREIDMLRRFAHPFIVKLEDVVVGAPPVVIPKAPEHMPEEGEDSAKDPVYLVFELGVFNLEDSLDQFRETGLEVGLAMTQILLALEHMHDYKTLHRDIKPGNFVYFPEQKCIKVIDFGFAIPRTPKYKLETTAYTQQYRAPEMIKGEEYYTAATDVWALGMSWLTLLMDYEIVLDKALKRVYKDAESETKAMDAATLSYIRTHQPRDHAPREDWVRFLGAHFSDALWQVLSRMITQEPSKRGTVREILELPYFEPYRELIQSTRATVAATVPKPLESYVIICQLSPERELMMEQCKTNKYLDMRMVFHAMDGIDRYLTWRIASNQQRPDEQTSVMRARVILYLYYKYFNILHFCDSFKTVFGMKRDLPAAQRRIAEDWEVTFCRDVCEYRLYRHTLFEMAKGVQKKEKGFYDLYQNVEKAHGTQIEIYG